MEPEESISLAGLARRLDLPLPRAYELQRRGILKPDSRIGRTSVYDPLRIPELRIRVQAATERPKTATLSTSAI